MPRPKPNISQLAHKQFAYLGIPEHFHDWILLNGKLIQLKRGEIYSPAGSKHLPLTLILQGKLFGYQVSEAGERKTSIFFTPTLRGVILDLPNLIKQEPTGLYIECLTSCTLLALPQKNFLELRQTSPAFTEWYTSTIEDFALRSVGLIRAMQMSGMKGTVQHLLQSFPDLFEEIPLKHLAEMLGTHRNTLKKILLEIQPDFVPAPDKDEDEEL